MSIKLPQVLPQVVGAAPQSPGNITPATNTYGTDNVANLAKGMAHLAGSALTASHYKRRDREREERAALIEDAKAKNDAETAKLKRASSKFSRDRLDLANGARDIGASGGASGGAQGVGKPQSNESLVRNARAAFQGTFQGPQLGPQKGSQKGPQGKLATSGGYLGTSGKAAYDGYDDAVAALTKARAQGQEGLSPEAQEAYVLNTQASFDATLRTYTNHRNKAATAWNAATTQELINSTSEAIESDGGNKSTIGQLKGYFRERGELMGEPKEVTESKFEAEIGRVVSNFTKTLVKEAKISQTVVSFEKAEKYLEDNTKYLSRDEKSGLTLTLNIAKSEVVNSQKAALAQSQVRNQKNAVAKTVLGWMEKADARTPLQGVAAARAGFHQWKLDNSELPNFAGLSGQLSKAIDDASKDLQDRHQGLMAELVNELYSPTEEGGQGALSPKELDARRWEKIRSIRSDLGMSKEGRAALEGYDKRDNEDVAEAANRIVALYHSDNVRAIIAEYGLRGEGGGVDAKAVQALYLKVLRSNPKAVGKVEGILDWILGKTTNASETAADTKVMSQTLKSGEYPQFMKDVFRPATSRTKGGYDQEVDEAALQAVVKDYQSYIVSERWKKGELDDKPLTIAEWWKMDVDGQGLWDSTPDNPEDNQLIQSRYMDYARGNVDPATLRIGKVFRKTLQESKFVPLLEIDGEDVGATISKTPPPSVFEWLKDQLVIKVTGGQLTREDELRVYRRWNKVGRATTVTAAIKNQKDIATLNERRETLGTGPRKEGATLNAHDLDDIAVIENDWGRMGGTIFNSGSGYTAGSPGGGAGTAVRWHQSLRVASGRAPTEYRSHLYRQRLANFTSVDELINKLPVDVQEYVSSAGASDLSAFFKDTSGTSVKEDYADATGIELNQESDTPLAIAANVNALMFVRSYVSEQVHRAVRNTTLDSVWEDLDTIYEKGMISDSQRSAVDEKQWSDYLKLWNARNPEKSKVVKSTKLHPRDKVKTKVVHSGLRRRSEDDKDLFLKGTPSKRQSVIDRLAKKVVSAK